MPETFGSFEFTRNAGFTQARAGLSDSGGGPSRRLSELRRRISSSLTLQRILKDSFSKSVLLNTFRD
jgi:hypothetical protein